MEASPHGLKLPATMSNPRPRLPPETPDHIVDLLHDNRETLQECCIVSKSWVPRARKHLFVHVKFKREDCDKWMKTFPDPINSPAYHVHTLTVGGSLRGAEDISWIRGFSSVDRLIVDCKWVSSDIASISLVPFHKLAASFKALDLTFVLLSLNQIFDLIRSLPLLEYLTLSGDDITVEDYELSEPPATVSSTPLVSTGTLALFLHASVGRILHQLLCLPSGLHFRRLDMSQCRVQDLLQVVETVAACSSTLEYPRILCQVNGSLAPSLALTFA